MGRLPGSDNRSGRLAATMASICAWVSLLARAIGLLLRSPREPRSDKYRGEYSPTVRPTPRLQGAPVQFVGQSSTRAAACGETRLKSAGHRGIIARVGHRHPLVVSRRTVCEDASEEAPCRSYPRKSAL